MILRAPGSVLLISCYELGHQPHGLAMPAAFLERAGFAPLCVDVAVEHLSDDHLASARLVVVSVPMHTALRIGARVAVRAKEQNPEVVICFTGHYAPMNRDYLLSLGADHILGGEYEEQLVQLARALDETEAEFAPMAVPLTKLEFPVPMRAELPPLDKYARMQPAEGADRLLGYTEASRGCLVRCRHCPVPAVYDGRFFVVNKATVLADIAQQVAAGAEHITFGDPDFLNGPGHGFAILGDVHARWPELSFDITTQVANLKRHRHRLRELTELGCAFVVTAVESLSDDVLRMLDKRHRRADFIEVLALCREAGLTLRPTLVTFTPWTTLLEVRELVDFLVREELTSHVDPIQLAIRLLVPPGSLLLDNPETRGYFGALDKAALTHTWTHRDSRVDELARSLSRRVALAAETDEASEATFDAIRTLVYQACGSPAPPAPVRRLSPKRRVPRVTEPWFC